MATASILLSFIFKVIIDGLKFRTIYSKKLPKFYVVNLVLGLVISFMSADLQAQTCPPNIDFETGNFNNWTCYTGNVAAVGMQNVITLNPSGAAQSNYHTMYAAGAQAGLDPYGGFPVNCPNGSGHSIKLGNDMGGGEAEGIAYEFTIPANQNAYTLIYNYAVVFQDPNHEEYQQPRMQIEITNVTDNAVISCASFSFRPYGTALPGFKISPNPGTNTPVWYKDWTAVSINLDGNAGKKIKLFFKTADCTFRRHFGYAYIDVNSECSGNFTGANYCPDDTVVNVTAPFGYQKYTWYDKTVSTVLGSGQILKVSPLPTPGTVLAVKLDPYDGYGCPQTLFTTLTDNLKVTADAGPDVTSCNYEPVQIGVPSRPGLFYSWTPSAGLSNAGAANPFANPVSTTTYILKANNNGGGCINYDTVVVKANIIDTSLTLIGQANYCIGSNDSAILKVAGADSVQWYVDEAPIAGATKNSYKVTKSGEYRALLYNGTSCNLSTRKEVINIASRPVAKVSVSNSNQCLVNNKLTFSNNSTNEIGAMSYAWNFGDGTLATSKDLDYSYTKAGKYVVKMTVSSNPGCSDSSSVPVEIYQNAVADFDIKSACIDIPSQVINNTIDTLSSPVMYSWRLGNAQTSTLRNPPAQTYTTPGTYAITLAVNTAQCPTPLNTVTRSLVVEKPKAAIAYPVQYALVDLPLTLQARQFGNKLLWSPATNLDNPRSYTPSFKGTTDQKYTVAIQTLAGCVTIDTQLVKTVKSVEVYVPSAFTPNSDSKNDYLRPLLMGVKEIRYFRVFNRWGQLVYETKTDKRGWDGTHNGVLQQSQTFVWAVDVVGVDGNIYSRKGTTVLIR
jgi:gliding motility-associated-like protein